MRSRRGRGLTTIAYIANEFPSQLEPYVIDEVLELRRRGASIICCSGKLSSSSSLQGRELELWKETLFFQPLSDRELTRAVRRLFSNLPQLKEITVPVFQDRNTRLLRGLRTLGHSVMGAALADRLAPLAPTHIHAHHGYFASWMALAAASLLDIGFSFTLHGSDLLKRGDLLAVKLRACRFCMTISDYNRRFILQTYPDTPPDKVIVQRLGVDRVLPRPESTSRADDASMPFQLLSVGRLHAVKDHPFLLQACAALRDQGFNFICRIVGEGPERKALQAQIVASKLQKHVCLVGYLSRNDLAIYYRDFDLVVMTSKSEGIPLVLMEAMARRKLVLAPAITGIPELIEHQRTGFLYQPGSLDDFVGAVRWIASHHTLLESIRRAAAASVAASYDRQRNLSAFADQFLFRISNPKESHAHSVLQQVRLSV